MILRHLKFENQWSTLAVLPQVQRILLENSGITRKIKLLLQRGRQCETNSHETAMPFLDQNVFPFSVEKDSHVVKALVFVTEAVPCCFCGFPWSEVLVYANTRQQSGPLEIITNKMKWKGFPDWRKFIFEHGNLKKKKRSPDILAETSNVELHRSEARGKLNNPQWICCGQSRVAATWPGSWSFTFLWPV